MSVATETVRQEPEATPAPVEFPWIKFPPFPTLPPNIKITPFQDFKPKGIQIALDPEPDHVEVDGEGIPTVSLRAKHDLTETEQRKRKKKLTKTAIGPGGQVRRLAWFEEWEGGEDLRRSNPDPYVVWLIHEADAANLTATDILTESIVSIRLVKTSERPGLGLSQLQACLSSGIISIQPPPSLKGKNAQPVDEDGDDDEDEDGDMATSQPNQEKIIVVDDIAAQEVDHVKQAEAARKQKERDEQAQLKFERRLAAKDARMNFFFDEPENAVKIFFSAHFRDKGLICVAAMPQSLLTSSYDLFSGAASSLSTKKGLKKALTVTELARSELPQTFVIGKALPDGFSDGCETIMGRMTEAMFWEGLGDESDKDKDEPEAKKRKLNTELEEFKAAVGETDVQLVDAETMQVDKEMRKEAVADNVDVNGVEVIPGSSWGDVPVESSTVGDWQATGAADGTGGWGNSSATGMGTWDMGTTDADWTTQTTNPLFRLLGPTVLPFTHTTGIVERSTRRIIKIVPPPADSALPPKKKGSKEKAPAVVVEEDLEKRLGYIVLGPWVKIGNHVASDVTSPKLLPDSRGAFVPIPEEKDATEVKQEELPVAEGKKPDQPAHDATKDEIAVFVDPAVLEKLVVGLGLGATWVQLARKEPPGDDGPEERKVMNWSKKNSNRRKGGPGKNGEPTKFWYMEQLMTILPSFHMDRCYPDQD
ncbi:hypothetical protein EW026_g5425 [Hermanssonia centrifuga]|uniref:Uncharacterized protein n=1 Tax=Hermanssonia centrifuga TaxID=98765 RepID=A0A4S4KED7_9APHY|nr:hypothetical protein EW026_g5425 [Hermanssonia centrifuga]